MNVGPSGFNNAPVTRALVIACTLFTIILGIRGRTNQLGWSYQDISQKLQIWKLIISGNYPAPISSTPEPPEDSIVRLVSMGFDRNSARQALIHSRNDVNTATNILLESQSH